MIFKARKICCEMLADRQYIIPENEENISFDNFKVRHQNNDLDLYVEHSEDSNDKIYKLTYEPLHSTYEFNHLHKE